MRYSGSEIVKTIPDLQKASYCKPKHSFTRVKLKKYHEHVRRKDFSSIKQKRTSSGQNVKKRKPRRKIKATQNSHNHNKAHSSKYSIRNNFKGCSKLHLDKNMILALICYGCENYMLPLMWSSQVKEMAKLVSCTILNFWLFFITMKKK